MRSQGILERTRLASAAVMTRPACFISSETSVNLSKQNLTNQFDAARQPIMEDDIKLWAKAGHGSGVTISGDSSARLTNLTAQATLKYSMKDYNAAAELYSHATELQARINGELSPGNADLLYVYGRCLYHVAVENSDVLGSKVAGEKPTEDLKEPEKIKPLDEGNVGKAVAKVVKENTKSVQPLEEGGQGSKPYFQFSGDENFGASDEENDGGKPDEEDEDADDEDDFANAYEVLDLARVLLLRKLEETKANNSKSRTTSDSPQLQQIRERLADIYDLQAEISLEGERFGNAVTDLKSALDLKMSLFPQHSSIIAEAYYKLSLALEFSSVTQQRDENGNIEEGKHSNIDYAMREDAAKKMEAAIASCRLRIQKEESKLQDTMPVEEDRSSLKVSRHEIDDVKEMVMDMEQRVSHIVLSYVHI